MTWRGLSLQEQREFVEINCGVSMSSAETEQMKKRPVPKQINKINSKSKEADATELDKLAEEAVQTHRDQDKEKTLLAPCTHTVPSAPHPSTAAITSRHMDFRVLNINLLCLHCELQHPEGSWVSHGHWLAWYTMTDRALGRPEQMPSRHTQQHKTQPLAI